jgi:hypothetical protein
MLLKGPSVSFEALHLLMTKIDILTIYAIKL